MLRERERNTYTHFSYFFSCCYAVPIFIFPCTKSEQSTLLLYIYNLSCSMWLVQERNYRASNWALTLSWPYKRVLAWPLEFVLSHFLEAEWTPIGRGIHIAPSGWTQSYPKLYLTHSQCVNLIPIHSLFSINLRNVQTILELLSEIILLLFHKKIGT